MEEKRGHEAQAQFLLEEARIRRRALDEIRQGGSAKYIGEIIAGAIILSPLFLKLGDSWSQVSLILGMVALIGWEQKWNQKRFDALISYLEKEGILK